MAFPGVRSAVKAMAEGGMTEQDAYNAEQRRLTAARSASALMDQRVAKANQEQRTDRNQGALEQGLDMTDVVNMAIMGDKASQFSAGQTGRGTMQENELQEKGIDMLIKGKMTPEVSNAINALIGRGSNQTAAHVNPTRDSELNQERVTALTNASNRSNPVGEQAKYSTVTDTQMIMALGDDPKAYAEYYSWLGKKSMTDPAIRHNAITLAKYMREKEQSAIQAITGDPAAPVVQEITDPTTLEGWGDLTAEEQKELLEYTKSQQAQ